jgi:pantetheine-phosphate adenylyltransferase
MVRQKNAVYPLSADPLHNGHLHNIGVAANSGMFEKVYVALGNNCNKKYLFSLDERLSLVRKTVYSNGFANDRIVVEPFFGILRNYAREKGAGFIIRGCRNSSDWDYEEVLSDYNGEYGLQTLVLPAPKELRNLSSTYLKSIAIEGGLVHDLVHPSVKQALEEKLRGISLIGVTGNMGAGKTTFCQRLVEYSQATKELEVSHIDFDRLVHSLYFGDSPLNSEVRQQIKESFGEDVFSSQELNRKKLAGLVFGDEGKRKELSRILLVPSMIQLEEELRRRKGIVLVDAAYFTEYNMLPLVNNNVILVNCSEKERFRRVLERDGMGSEELIAKTKAQHSQDLKRKIILEAQKKSEHGFFYEVDSEEEIEFGDVLEKIEASFPMFKSEVRENVYIRI